MRFVILLIAAVVAVAAGVAALQISGKNANTQQTAAAPQPAQSNVSTVDVLVAKVPVPMGATLDESMIERQPWPSHLVLDGFITADSKDANLVGKVARAPFAVREPFMTSKLANPNDPSFLAATLPEGMRAITLATDAISGIAGYVFPGDRVDILLTHNIPKELKFSKGSMSTGSSKPELSEVLVPNVRVLAVNIRPANSKDTQSTNPTNVTLEVSEEGVEKVRLAEKNGYLSLALRSIKDKDKTEVPDVVPIQNLSRINSDVTEASSGEEIRIIRGAGKQSDNPEDKSEHGASDSVGSGIMPMNTSGITPMNK